MTNEAEPRRIQPGGFGKKSEIVILAGLAYSEISGMHPAENDLVAREIPHEAIDSQLRLYTPEATQIKDIRRFNPFNALSQLRKMVGKLAITFDMGGKKIAAEKIEVGEDGKLQSAEKMESMRSANGAGYVEYIKKISGQVNGGDGCAVGFSFAGPSDGTRPLVYTNLPYMQPELEAAPYNGNLANLFLKAERVDGGHDGTAGVVAAVIEAARINPKIKKVIFIINGGGIGGGAWVRDGETGADGVIKAAEPGHIKVIDALNPYGQKTPCGQKGSSTPDSVCIERVAGSGAGIEDIHYQLTGKTKIVDGKEKPLEGEEIEQKYLQGDTLATDLIDNATILTATAILGLDQATRPEDTKDAKFDPESTVVVCHGGFFRYAGVRDRIERILEERIETVPQILYTDDFTKETTGNACADGAAILALTAPQRALN